MKKVKCLVCLGVVKEICKDFKTPRIDKTTKKNIVVKNVKTYECLDKDCGHTWVPSVQEERIYATIRRRTRYSLSPEDIKMTREALPFVTKTEVADFLNLNSKAFVKWEKGNTTPNGAYDLLLRLVAYKKDNLEFIKRLHKKDFAFDLEDYEFLMEKYSIKSGVRITSSKPEVSVNTNENKFPDIDDEGNYGNDNSVALATHQETLDSSSDDILAEAA